MVRLWGRGLETSNQTHTRLRMKKRCAQQEKETTWCSFWRWLSFARVKLALPSICTFKSLTAAIQAKSSLCALHWCTQRERETQTHTYTHTHRRARAHAHAHTHTYIQTHTHTHTHTHTGAHSNSQNGRLVRLHRQALKSPHILERSFLPRK